MNGSRFVGALDMNDGIEIHFDEKRGYLELACEPDAFAPYREIARNQLVDNPEILIDKVLEINIVDTAMFVARRDAPRRRFWDVVVTVAIIAVLCLAAVGAAFLVGLVIRGAAT
jgi:hypothetical protein